MITFNIITLFPENIDAFLTILPYKKAIDKNIAKINLIDLKKYSVNSYGSVDDKPYGGGVGMILRIEPIYNALKDLKMHAPDKLTKDKKTILLSPKGSLYNQQIAGKFAKLKEITLICGRYEGVDQRVHSIVTDVISIGNFVLSGGELPALAITESILRLQKGILEKDEAAINESFSNPKSIEYPQYTRPAEFMGMQVPEVLLSGNHQEIETWRKNSTKGS